MRSLSQAEWYGSTQGMNSPPKPGYCMNLELFSIRSKKNKKHSNPRKEDKTVDLQNFQTFLSKVELKSPGQFANNTESDERFQRFLVFIGVTLVSPLCDLFASTHLRSFNYHQVQAAASHPRAPCFLLLGACGYPRVTNGRHKRERSQGL
jgi:hypothetical protein